uniref:Brain cDNA, clone MNCb-5555 n=1 Tax=Mus musculus TaxID=10090 RepID=Q9JJF5_MOUSE|nr:unnamed protein product [Mus musculus]
MSVQVVSAAAAAKVPEVELKDLSPSEAEPQLGLSAAAVGAMVPPAGGRGPRGSSSGSRGGAAPGPRPGLGAHRGSEPCGREGPSSVRHEAERPSSPAPAASRRRRGLGQPRRHGHRGAAHGQEGTGVGLPRFSERRGGRAREWRPFRARRHPVPHPLDRGAESLLPPLNPLLERPPPGAPLRSEASRYHGRTLLITWR